MKLLPILFVGCCIIFSKAQSQLPETDIFLASISKENGEWIFGQAENITDRPGYENQPWFTPAADKILYVISDKDQTDIAEYSIAEKRNKILISSPESEFSPSYNPGNNLLSVVRVDLDSGQRFYTIKHNASDVNVVPNTDSIGYYSWLNDSLLSMFVLGERFSLQVLNVNSGKKTFIMNDIGRCMKLSPAGDLMYFVDKSDSTEWIISSLKISDFSVQPVTKVIKGNEDFCILPDGSMLMGSESKLYLRKPGQDNEWRMIKDYSNTMKSFYRIAVDVKGSKIAFVAFTGERP